MNRNIISRFFGGGRFDLFLNIFLFLSPIIYWGNMDSGLVQNTFFVFGVFALFGISLYEEPKRDFKNGWLGGIVLWALFCSFINKFPDQEIPWANFAFMSEGFIYVLVAALLFYLVYRYSSGKIWVGILGVCILNLALALSQRFWVDWMFIYNYPMDLAGGWCGFMRTAPALGIYSAIVTPVLFGISPYLAIIPLICLVISKSMTAGVALVLATLLRLWPNRKVFWGLLGISVIMGIIKWPAMVSGWGVRPEVFALTMRDIAHSPLLGRGFEVFLQNWGMVYTASTGWVYRYNDFLQISRLLGIPALILVIGFFKSIFKNSTVTWSCVTVLMIMIGQSTIYQSKLGGTIVVLLAIMAIGGNNGNKGK